MPHIDSFHPTVDKLKAQGATHALVREATIQVHKALRLVECSPTSDSIVSRAIDHLTIAIDYLRAIDK